VKLSKVADPGRLPEDHEERFVLDMSRDEAKRLLQIARNFILEYGDYSDDVGTEVRNLLAKELQQ